MKIALVCSWLNQYGGAERVLEQLHELYPDAPIYTSVYDSGAMPAFYRTWEIRTSFLQRLPFVRRYYQFLLPLYPLAFEQFDLSGYDVVLSNTSAFGHGVITRPETCHICYCLTPARFLWGYHDYARRENLGGVQKLFLTPILATLRAWDVAAAQRVDHFVAISQTIATRIQKYYRRSATIIYPSIDTTRFEVSDEIDDYFLVVSRLVPYKRIDLAVQACSKLGLKLKVVGDGRARAALERLAGPGVEFLGRRPDGEVRRLLSHCRGFLFPGEEDFGLTPLEAQASGRPVLAYGAGGSLETIRDGETGRFVHAQTVEAWTEALAEFVGRRWDGQAIRRHAERFDVRIFKQQVADFVAQRWAEHRNGALSNGSPNALGQPSRQLDHS